MGSAIGRAAAVSGPQAAEAGRVRGVHTRMRLRAFSLDNVTAGRILRGAPGQSWPGPSAVVLLAQARCRGWPEGARLLVPVAQAAHGTKGWS